MLEFTGPAKVDRPKRRSRILELLDWLKASPLAQTSTLPIVSRIMWGLWLSDAEAYRKWFLGDQWTAQERKRVAEIDRDSISSMLAQGMAYGQSFVMCQQDGTARVLRINEILTSCTPAGPGEI